MYIAIYLSSVVLWLFGGGRRKLCQYFRYSKFLCCAFLICFIYMFLSPFPLLCGNRTKCFEISRLVGNFFFLNLVQENIVNRVVFSRFCCVLTLPTSCTYHSHCNCLYCLDTLFVFLYIFKNISLCPVTSCHCIYGCLNKQGTCS